MRRLSIFWISWCKVLKKETMIFRRNAYKFIDFWFYSKLIILLAAIFFCLHLLHGESFAICGSLYPDEIMDFHCSVPSLLSNDENDTYLPLKDFSVFLVLSLSIKPVIIIVYKNLFPNISFNQFSLKKKFFSLERYNSWHLLLQQSEYPQIYI